MSDQRPKDDPKMDLSATYVIPGGLQLAHETVDGIAHTHTHPLPEQE